MTHIGLVGITKSFGTVDVIKSVDLAIDEGEFVVFVGPSGCGKSTMLRMIAGLEQASSGKILIEGNDVTGKGADKRGLAMVFQSYALYPHMTVRENMSFSLGTSGLSKDHQNELVERSADILQLGGLLERKPKELSGGQRQRVAIGRAIVREPVAFLFDEPLSNLDAALRGQMRIELARLHKALGKTMIYVTHDQVEAMTLADRIAVLNDGSIQQAGPPLELYDAPANVFVATFIGSPRMNVIDCSAGSNAVTIADGATLPVVGDPAGVAKLGIRPEHIRPAETSDGLIAGTVGVTEHLGSDSFIHVDVRGIAAPINMRVAGGAPISVGDRIGLDFDRGNVHFFDALDRRADVTVAH